MASLKEIKLKAKVSDFSSVKAKLKSLAKFTKNVEYIDYFFKSDNGVNVSELRLRNKEETRTIMVKLLIERNQVQVNNEYSFSVDKPEDCVNFLEALGFHAHISMQKLSEVYFAGDIRIELARIKDLGSYVELTVHFTGDDIKEKVEIVESFAAKLGLKKEQMDSRYYPQIKEEG